MNMNEHKRTENLYFCPIVGWLLLLQFINVLRSCGGTADGWMEFDIYA